MIFSIKIEPLLRIHLFLLQLLKIFPCLDLRQKLQCMKKYEQQQIWREDDKKLSASWQDIFTHSWCLCHFLKLLPLLFPPAPPQDQLWDRPNRPSPLRTQATCRKGQALLLLLLPLHLLLLPLLLLLQHTFSSSSCSPSSSSRFPSSSSCSSSSSFTKPPHYQSLCRTFCPAIRRAGCTLVPKSLVLKSCQRTE